MFRFARDQDRISHVNSLSFGDLTYIGLYGLFLRGSLFYLFILEFFITKFTISQASIPKVSIAFYK